MQNSIGSGPLWTHASAIEGWTPKVVSIGNGGTEVLSEFGPFSDYTRLFSAFDTNPPVPMWQSLSPVATFHHHVDSADATDTHVSLYDVYADATLQNHRVFVNKYSALDPQNNWTYAFPFLTGGHEYLGVQISTDGSRIAAVVHNSQTNKEEVALFSPGSSAPIGYLQVALQGAFRGFELSADGKKLYLCSGLQLQVLDLPSGSLLYQEYLFEPIYKAHAISGDGRFFAFGSNGKVKVYKRASPTSGSYSLALTHTLPGQVYCDRLDLSDDGSTLVCGFNHSNDFRTVTIQAVDLASGALTMSENVVGIGPNQNLVSDICASADGSRFAVGLWGDATGNALEVRAYARNQNAPVFAYDLPGSVYDIDLSPDGKRLAVASKAMHLNVAGAGGEVDLFQVQETDIVLHGAPLSGNTVTLDVKGLPGQTARLLYSDAPFATPTVFPGIGTLYLERSTTHLIAMGPIGGSGIASVPFTLPSSIGSTISFQGYTYSPRHLSSDWIKIVVLP